MADVILGYFLMSDVLIAMLR